MARRRRDSGDDQAVAFEQIQQVPTEHTENTEKTSGTLSSVSSVYSVGKKSGGRRFALEPQSVLEPFAQRGARAEPEEEIMSNSTARVPAPTNISLCRLPTPASENGRAFRKGQRPHLHNSKSLLS